MDCAEIFASRHALRRLFQRSISMDEAVRIVREGEIIEEYPGDEPWPETVLLGETSRGPIHVVVGRSETGRCVMITVYWPDHHRWDDEFRRRR